MLSGLLYIPQRTHAKASIMSERAANELAVLRRIPRNPVSFSNKIGMSDAVITETS
jgi:hypothetical protein